MTGRVSDAHVPVPGTVTEASRIIHNPWRQTAGRHLRLVPGTVTEGSQERDG
jgi:hypothetical protein